MSEINISAAGASQPQTKTPETEDLCVFCQDATKQRLKNIEIKKVVISRQQKQRQRNLLHGFGKSKTF